MKYAVALFVSVLFLAFGADAQDSQVLPSTSVAASDATVVPSTPRMFASVALPAPSLPDLPEGFPSPAANSPLPQRGVPGIDQTYSFQAYVGYTFVHFNAFPAREVNRNGLDISMSYSIKQGLFGVEGALTAAFGSIANESSDFAFVGGGPRVRWSGPQGLEFWAHGLVGDAHFGPRVASFGQGGFAYELGGGVDIAAHFRRLAYRVEADMIGSRFYNTNQFSPKVSAGIVYKF